MPHIPVHPSAQKRHRQSLKREARNRAIKTRVRTASKQTLVAIEGKSKEAAEAALAIAKAEDGNKAHAIAPNLQPLAVT